MNEKSTLFSRVYDDLKARILTNQFPAGSTFPSIQKLREEYQIGFRTAREVTKQLCEEGLIEIQPRKAPVVSQSSCHIPEDTVAIKILSEKDSLFDVYETIICLLPSLFTFASQNCNLEFLPHYKQAIKAIRRGLKPSEWRIIFLLCQEMLRFSGNPLISDLYTSLARYSYLSYLFEEPKIQMCDILKETGQFINILTLQNPYERFKLLTIAFKKLRDGVTRSLDSLEMQYGEAKTTKKDVFLWNTSYSYSPNYRYTDIVFDLITKITSGVYPPDSYLPHEAVLAREYDVSLSTLRKALYELQNLGYCETFNVKGTIVLNLGDKYLEPTHTIHNPAYKKKTLLYLYSIQFMSLVIGPSAQEAVSYFTDTDRQMIIEKMKDPDTNIIKAIVDTIILRLPLETMKTILRKTAKMIRWTYYFSFCGSNKEHFQIMNNQKQKICQALIDDNQKQLAAELSSYYCQILDISRNFFVDYCQLNEAAKIYTPKIDADIST